MVGGSRTGHGVRRGEHGWGIRVRMWAWWVGLVHRD